MTNDYVDWIKKRRANFADRVARFEAERDALKADKERLDWLEAKRQPLIPCFGLAPAMGSGIPIPFEGFVIRSDDADPKPLREAIDAARKAQP